MRSEFAKHARIFSKIGRYIEYLEIEITKFRYHHHLFKKDPWNNYHGQFHEDLYAQLFKHFDKISNDGITRLNIYVYNNKWYKCCIRIGRNVRSLNVCAGHMPDYETYVMAVENFPKVERPHIQSYTDLIKPIGNDVFAKLSLKALNVNQSCLSENLLVHIIQENPQLESLLIGQLRCRDQCSK